MLQAQSLCANKYTTFHAAPRHLPLVRLPPILCNGRPTTPAAQECAPPPRMESHWRRNASREAALIPKGGSLRLAWQYASIFPISCCRCASWCRSPWRSALMPVCPSRCSLPARLASAAAAARARFSSTDTPAPSASDAEVLLQQLPILCAQLEGCEVPEGRRVSQFPHWLRQLRAASLRPRTECGRN